MKLVRTLLTMGLALALPIPAAMTAVGSTTGSPAASVVMDTEASDVVVTVEAEDSVLVGGASAVTGTVVGLPSDSWSTDIRIQVLEDGVWTDTGDSAYISGESFRIELYYKRWEVGTHTFRVSAQSSAPDQDTIHYSPEFQFTYRAPAITATSAGTKMVGLKTFVWGTVEGSPTHVNLEVLVDGTWTRGDYAPWANTNDSGGYTMELNYGADQPGTYTFRVVTDNGGASPPVELTRTAVAITAATAGRKEVGEETFVWGMAPNALSSRVFLNYLVDGQWSSGPWGTTDADGYYTLPLTYGATTPGTHTFRVTAVAPTGYFDSPEVQLTRTGVHLTAATAGTKRIHESTFVWGTARYAPHTRVVVQALVNGTWSNSQSGYTDSDGFYALPLTYGASAPGTYSYRTAVEQDGKYFFSPAVELTRIGVPITATTAGTKPAGAETYVWGRAQGAPRARVTVQALVKGTWSSSQSGYTDANGYYTLPLTYGANARGTHTFRVVVWQSGALNPSAPVTLTRT